MAERMDLKNDVSVGMLSRFPDVLTQTAAPTNEDELWEDVRTVAEQAVDAFVAMRAVEGEKMKADVAGRLTTIETLVAKIEENSAGRVQAYSDKLYARLQELLGDRSIDEGRLVTEAAILRTRPPSTRKPSVCTAMWRSTARSSSWTSRLAASSTFDAGVEPRVQHDWLQVPGRSHHAAGRRSEIRNRKIREQIQNIE